MMSKRLISIFTLLAFVLALQTACASMRIGYSATPGYPPDSRWPPKDMEGPNLIAITAIFLGVCLAAVSAIIIFRQKTVLSDEGSQVHLLVHREAPAEAEFISDILVTEYDPILVKISLRNKAAKLGGNLVVVDVISGIVSDGSTASYFGSGRVYLLPDSLRESLKHSD